MPDDRPVAPKFCKDCRHFDGVNKNFERCNHIEARIPQDEHYLVTGERKDERAYCNVLRMKSQLCGADAKLWEPK